MLTHAGIALLKLSTLARHRQPAARTKFGLHPIVDHVLRLGAVLAPDGITLFMFI